MAEIKPDSRFSRLQSKETFMYQIITGILILIIAIMFLKNMIDPLIIYGLFGLTILYILYKLLLRPKTLSLETMVTRVRDNLRRQGITVDRTHYTACYSPHDPDETIIDFFRNGRTVTYNWKNGLVEIRRSSIDDIRKEKEESTTFADVKRKVREEERIKEELRKRGLFEDNSEQS